MIRSITLDCEIVLLGLDEAEALFGIREPDAIFDTLFTQGKAKYAAIKDGGNGALVADADLREKLPPFPCKPVEPIGAGDGFQRRVLGGNPAGQRCCDRRTHGRCLRCTCHPNPRGC